MTDRVFLIVVDSFGIGAMPDSANYGDEGANTLLSIMRSDKFSAENMKKLGLFNIDGLSGGVEKPIGAYARMREKSNGKDTIIGHWEMCGVISERICPPIQTDFRANFSMSFQKDAAEALSATSLIRARRLLPTTEKSISKRASSSFIPRQTAFSR